jgi:hypothetical protein
MVVLPKYACKPEDRKARVVVTLGTSSPTVSLSAPEYLSNPFQLVVSLRIVSSTRPGQPVYAVATASYIELPTS